MAKQQAYRRPEDSFEAFRLALAKDGAGPLYLVHGPEELLAGRALEMIGEAAGGGSAGVDRQTFGEDSDPREVTLAASAYPMLGGRRLVVVRDAEKLTGTGPLEAYAADPAPTTTLVVVSRKPDFRTRFFQILKERAVVVECRAPYDDRIGGWIESEVRAAGRTIDPEAAELLHLAVGGSLAEIVNELEKLYTYAGERRAITPADVERVVGISRQFSIFDLQRAIGELRAGPALAIVGRMIDTGENMTRCVAQLTHFVEKLWLLPPSGLPPDQAASLLGIKPFFVREYLSARRNFTPERFDRCFLALRDADVALKSSGGPPRRIMTVLIHEMTRKAAGAPGNIPPADAV